MASAAAVEVEQLSADDLLALPDDGCRHELVEGTLRTTTPPVPGTGGPRPGCSCASGPRRRPDLGAVVAAETGFLLARDPDTVRAPDLAFVRAGRAAAPEAPGLAVPLPEP